MLTGIKAIIFDMDGVIIDSEPLWRRAMIQSFNEIGIPFTDDECRMTTGLRFIEVAEFWFTTHNVTHMTIFEFDHLVISRLCDLIRSEGKLMKGVDQALQYFKKQGYKIALGTSSNVLLMNTVIDELGIRNYFDAVCSAQHLEFGKPHPEVFLNCAKELQVKPNECLVIEDSVNGVIAAKAAQMKTLAIPEEENWNNPKFAIADYKLHSLVDFLVIA
jgi:mannitol-1-/sugar-/sorbitol-6-/2-deoxyglucose-6-phosphatase